MKKSTEFLEIQPNMKESQLLARSAAIRTIARVRHVNCIQAATAAANHRMQQSDDNTREYHVDTTKENQKVVGRSRQAGRQAGRQINRQAGKQIR